MSANTRYLAEKLLADLARMLDEHFMRHETSSELQARRIAAIESALASVQAEAGPKWNRESERMPQRLGQRYLVTVEWTDTGDRMTTTAIFDVYGWMIKDFQRVVAWAEMPAPFTPPQEGE